MVTGRGGVLCFYGTPSAALAFFDVEDYDDIYAELDDGPPVRRSPAPSRRSIAPWLDERSHMRSVTPHRSAPAVLPQAVVLAQRYRTLLTRDRRNLTILLGQAPVLAILIA